MLYDIIMLIYQILSITVTFNGADSLPEYVGLDACARARAHTHTRTHARTHAHTHTHTETMVSLNLFQASVF